MSGQIFISYRREESRWSVRSMYDRLATHFDRKQIFMDVDTLKPGVDFVDAIEKSVGSCDLLIAVIGACWVTVTDEQGRRRLDNSEDFVRREIATALRREIRVIPVLVDGAVMPRQNDLPDDLKPLVRRNALPVSDTRFDDDCQRLVTAIEQVFEVASAERRLREEKEQLEAQARATEAMERLVAARRQKEAQAREQLEQNARSAPLPGLVAPRKRLPWWVWCLGGAVGLTGLALWLIGGLFRPASKPLPIRTPVAINAHTPAPIPVHTPSPVPIATATPLLVHASTPAPIPIPTAAPLPVAMSTPIPSATSTPALFAASTPVPVPAFTSISRPGTFTAAPPAPVDPTTEVSAFIKKFWSHCVSKDPDDWASDFADQSSYCYNPGRLTGRSFIRNDRAQLLERYPLRHYEFSDPAIQMKPGNNGARVTFSFTYKYSGRKPAAGSCRTTLNVERSSGTWVITEYDEQVFRE
jgi:TIR domain